MEVKILNYFLVDYENVNVAGLNGITSLTENDSVIIFYSENADTLTFGMHRRINESKAEIKFQKVEVKEKNALDFQLCTYLGYLIRDTMTEENLNNYFVVSNDKSYLSLIDYWKRFKIDLQVVSDLSEKKVTLSEEKNFCDELDKELWKILTHQSDIDEVKEIIKNSKTKVEVNNNLGKKFTSQQGGKIYRAVKKFISDKKTQ